MKSSTKKRMIITFGIFVLLIFLVVIWWRFSAQAATQSNQLSMQIVEWTFDKLDKHFYMNRRDIFWELTFNQLLRKAAHFIEYAVIASVICIMFNVATKRALPAALISIVISPILSIIDEYHQRLSPMRTPRMFDIYVDVAGALTGIIMITLIFLVFNYIVKLKGKINELERLLEREQQTD